MESILTSIKKLLGITEDYKHFDPDIIMHINSTFMILAQLGVGPREGFAIQDEYATWDQFIPADSLMYECVKSYMYIKVRLLFDPPVSSALQSYERQAAEYEWRLMASAELKDLNGTTN